MNIQQQLDQLEQTVELTLPAAFKQFYLDGGTFLPLATILERWQAIKHLLDTGIFDPNEAESDPGIQAVWWHTG